MSSMDILLIAPPESERVKAFSAREYLGLEYLAAFLRHHEYEVALLNCNSGTTAQEAVEAAITMNPRVVGIGIPAQPSLLGALRLIKNLHTAGYDGHITLGGHAPTFGFHDILRTMPEINTVVRGEGELTLLELMQTIESGGAFSDVKGISFRDGDEIVINPSRPLIKDIDALPFPSRDFLEEIIEKIPASARAAIATGRGCHRRCTFCSVRAFYDLSKGPKIRLRSPKRIVDEIEGVVDRYNVSSFLFVDDNFIGPGNQGKRRAAEIAQEIMKRGLDINFAMFCRADDVEEKLFILLKRAGLVRVFVGIESGVQSMLDRFRKGITVEENARAINILRKNGIVWDAGFMLYDPDTTFEEFKENVQFIRKINLYRYPSAVTLLNGLRIFPGTPIEATLRDAGRLNYIQGENNPSSGNVWDGDESQIRKVLQLLNPDYEISNPDFEVIRQIVDETKVAIDLQYAAIWPLLIRWDYWLESVMKTTRFHLNVLNAIPEFKVYLGDQIERWCSNVGALIINILEAIVDFFENNNQRQEASVLFSHINSMISKYNMSHFNTSFEEKIAEIQELLNKEQFEFQANGVSYLLSFKRKDLTVLDK